MHAREILLPIQRPHEIQKWYLDSRTGRIYTQNILILSSQFAFGMMPISIEFHGIQWMPKCRQLQQWKKQHHSTWNYIDRACQELQGVWRFQFITSDDDKYGILYEIVPMDSTVILFGIGRKLHSNFEICQLCSVQVSTMLGAFKKCEERWWIIQNLWKQRNEI